MSKKLAEGIDALVLDVKIGDGAFMKTFEDSKALAQAMVDDRPGHGQEGGRPHHRHGPAAGPHGGQRPRGRGVHRDPEGPRPEGPGVAVRRARGLDAVPAPDGAELDAARQKVREALASGAGLRKFQQVVELQGGDPRVCDDPRRLPRARETVDVQGGARRPGHPHRLPRGGPGGHAPGGGARDGDSAIDPAVGLVLHKKVGDLVIPGEPLVTVHVNDRRRLEEVTGPPRTAITHRPPRRPCASPDPGRARLSGRSTGRALATSPLLPNEAYARSGTALLARRPASSFMARSPYAFSTDRQGHRPGAHRVIWAAGPSSSLLGPLRASKVCAIGQTRFSWLGAKSTRASSRLSYVASGFVFGKLGGTAGRPGQGTRLRLRLQGPADHHLLRRAVRVLYHLGHHAVDREGPRPGDDACSWDFGRRRASRRSRTSSSARPRPRSRSGLTSRG